MATTAQLATAAEIKNLVFDALPQTVKTAVDVALDGIARIRRGSLSDLIDTLGDEIDATEMWATIHGSDQAAMLRLYAQRIMYRPAFQRDRQAIMLAADFIDADVNPYNIACTVLARAAEQAKRKAAE